MGLFVWKWRVEKMWDWGQGIVLVSGGPSWEGFYVQLYKVVTTIVLVVCVWGGGGGIWCGYIVICRRRYINDL